MENLNNTTGTQLQEIASKFNLFTYEGMTQEYKDIFDNKLNDYSKKPRFTIPEFFNNNPSFEIGIYYQCKVEDARTDKEYKYIEHNYILVKYINSELIFILSDIWNKQGKFSLYPYYEYFNKFNSISNSLKNAVREKENEPNYIGVFSDKKVIQWVTYQERQINALNALLIEVNNKNIENENFVNDFIKKLGDKATVSKWENRTQKHYNIHTALFDVYFTIHLDINYLEKKISFKGDINEIIKITSKI